MLKFHFKKERLHFTETWVTPEREMMDDNPDTDLLTGLLEGNPQKGLDNVMNFINQREEDI